MDQLAQMCTLWAPSVSLLCLRNLMEKMAVMILAVAMVDQVPIKIKS